jgi:hypothetical protein
MTEQITTNFACDGPGCTEESAEPQNWLTVTIQNGQNSAIVNKYALKHFHNEACLVAYVEA